MPLLAVRSEVKFWHSLDGDVVLVLEIDPISLIGRSVINQILFEHPVLPRIDQKDK